MQLPVLKLPTLPRILTIVLGTLLIVVGLTVFSYAMYQTRQKGPTGKIWTNEDVEVVYMIVDQRLEELRLEAEAAMASASAMPKPSPVNYQADQGTPEARIQSKAQTTPSPLP